MEHFRQAIIFGSIFSVFHRGENSHENAGMFGKLVLSVAASFFDNFGLVEFAMYSKIEIIDFLHRRKVFSRSAECFRITIISCVAVLKRSAERLKTFRRCKNSIISIFEYILRSLSLKLSKKLAA